MINSMTIIKAIMKPLTFICNHSFSAGIFPNRMKIALVIPFFKKFLNECFLFIFQFLYYVNCEKSYKNVLE